MITKKQKKGIDKNAITLYDRTFLKVIFYFYLKRSQFFVTETGSQIKYLILHIFIILKVILKNFKFFKNCYNNFF